MTRTFFATPSISNPARSHVSISVRPLLNASFRRHGKQGTEYFHRSVVCMSVGGPPHVILGQEMLKPRDGNEKDEGELTGGKRLIQRLRKRHGHFADLIVADALYLNAPFINTVLSCGMETVIRLKDEKRLIFKDALQWFRVSKSGSVSSGQSSLRECYAVHLDQSAKAGPVQRPLLAFFPGCSYANACSCFPVTKTRYIHEETIDRMKRNRIWKHGTIGGCRVAAVDGVELFGSTKKSCPDCLARIWYTLFI